MIREFSEFSTGAVLKIGDTSLFASKKADDAIALFTFIWSTEHLLKVSVDGVPTEIPPNSILALTPNQHLIIAEETKAIVYQFNREFYCIKDHDKEVSCAGLLFFGAQAVPMISLDVKEQRKFQKLHEIFLEEMDTKDTIQAEMLQILLARFIIKTTRLLKVGNQRVAEHGSTLDMYREFNLLVESHFKEAHNVSFYAEKLHKSPKTLSNTFSKYNKSPLQLIHERIVLEAKRQLTYTDKTTKQIAFDVGFDDPSHLSRMFKKQTQRSPSVFKKSLSLTTY
jgi:AraC family transcriptional activator of pobA